MQRIAEEGHGGGRGEVCGREGGRGGRLYMQWVRLVDVGTWVRRVEAEGEQSASQTVTCWNSKVGGYQLAGAARESS